jgi:DNA-binding NtrC family response regulator
MKHATIFVVDDESDSLDALIHALQAASFKTLIVSSGERTRRQLELTQPELLLLEVLMPDTNGFETSEGKDGSEIGGILSQIGNDLTNLGLREALEEFEKRYIMRMLDHNNGHRRRTAKMLGLPLRTFQRKIKKFGLI